MQAQAPTPRNSFGPAQSVSAAPGNGHATEAENPATQAFHEVPVYIAELKSYANYLVSAKVDGVKATARRIAIFAALGVVGLLAATGLIFTAIFLVFGGLALGLGELLGSRLWLGALIVGIVILGVLGVGMWMALKKATKAWRLKTEQKYAGKSNEQRGKFGHDVHERGGHPAAKRA